MPKAGAIENALNVEQLQQFTQMLMSEPKVTLKVIQDKFTMVTGESVSHEAARTYKRNVYQREIERLSKAQELAMQLASVNESETGESITDASAALLSQEVFNFIINGEFDIKDMERLTRMVVNLKLGKQRDELLSAKLRESEAKVKEMQQKEEQRLLEAEELRQRIEKEKTTGRGISEETMAMIEQKIGLL